MRTDSSGDGDGELDPRAFPLSHVQKGLWFAQQLHPEVPFLVAQYIELHGHVDLGALRWASEQGSFDMESPGIRLVAFRGEPYQLADETIEDELGYVDLRESTDPIAAAHRWMDERRRRPMDVFTDRLMDATLLQVGDNHYFLTTFAHHLTLDGYGAMVLTRRVAELYTHNVSRSEAPPSKALHIRDLYEAEDAYIGTRRFDIDREYWAERTRELPVPSRFTDKKAYPSALSLLASGHLESVLADQLNDTARSWNTPVVPLVVAGFAAFLSRMTGNTDIVLSFPVTARTTAAARRSGGSVANVVPLRVHIEPHGDVAELVRRVQLEMTGALRHQRYRYEDILRDARSSSGESHGFGPMVNVMMFNQDIWWGDLLGELNVVATGPVEDLSINLYPGVGGHGIRVDFEANPAVYERDELTSLHTRFMTFLAGLADPTTSTTVGRLPLLTDDERASLAPATGLTGVPRATLPEILDRTAHVGGIAVRDSDSEVTYRDLHARSNRLARTLIEWGVGAGDRVALLLPRSVEQVVALWAVVRTGGAFVPIDPSYPASRIANIVAESGVTKAISIGPEPVPAGIEWMAVEDRAGDGSPVTDADRRHPLRIDNAAYVIYTSGSVGAPRGTTITHHGLANHVAAVRRMYAADEQSRILTSASPSYDAAIHDLLVAVTAGAMLVVAPPALEGGAKLAELIGQQQISHWTTTPAVLATMDPAEMATLQVVAVAGDVCPPDLVSRWGVGRRILNLYGPTEVTIWATATEASVGDTNIPIGEPIEGTSAVVLDRFLQPAPVGVVGELYLSGPGVGRGYLARPGATAARFVANPYSPDIDRIYRTGDLVRWTSDHLLEFVDRADDQVRIRGYRVELGEVTAVLGGCSGVDSAIAVAQTMDDELTISAYVVGNSVDPENVRAHAARHLPEYMVPSTITVLDAMPLKPSGKVDRDALPPPVRYQRELRYWQEQLRGMQYTVDLPHGGGATRTRTPDRAILPSTLDPQVSSALDRVARDHDASVFAVLTAAVAVLVSTLSGAEDFAIGATFDDAAIWPGSGRGPVALRTRVDHRASFVGLVAEARDCERAARLHSGIPFDKVVSAVGGRDDSGRHPLFQVLLGVDSAVPELGGVDLTVSVDTRGDAARAGFVVDFHYAEEVFDHATVRGWVARLHRLLDLVTANPSIAVGSIDLLSDSERTALVGAPPEPAPPRLSLPDMFLRRAEERPDSIAVGDGHSAATYAELERRSSQLARVLFDRGVRAESVVAVAISESIDLVVAHLAVFRLGAGCVPLPPDYPTERLRYMLAATRPVVVLSRRVDVGNVPVVGSRALLVDGSEASAVVETGALVTPIHPDGVAYILCHEAARPIVVTHGNMWARMRAPAVGDILLADIWCALLAGEQAALRARGQSADSTLGWTSEARTYVLDRSMRPVPPGTVGELYVAGRQAGRGYDRLPPATAVHFVADPFVARADPGARMYRTGESARYVDGHLQTVGSQGNGTAVDIMRRALRGVGTPAPLQTDQSKAGARTGDTPIHRFTLPASSHRSAVRLASLESATLFSVLRAATAVLSARLGAHRDFVIGTGISSVPGRSNTLALRAVVPTHVTFRMLVEQVRDVDLEAFGNHEVSFADIDDLIGGRLPQVFLTLSSGPTLPDFASIPVADSAHPDVHFAFAEHWADGAPAGLEGVIVCSPGVFHDGTAESLADLFADVMDAVTSDPDAEVDEISLDPGEHLDGGPASDPVTLAEILTATADAHPHSAALTDGHVTLTYRDLDGRSDALAADLIARGAVPGSVVALGLRRSVDFTIALWAITKTGAAFLPVDPEHPAERLDRIFAESRVRIGVGQMSPTIGNVDWVAVPTAESANTALAVRVSVSPDDVAYIIYTSGSTGAPKGVMVPHSGLSSLRDEAVRRYRATSNSRVLQGYNPTFDAAMLEALLAFGAGGCLVVAPAEVYAGPDLHRILVDNRVTHYLSTPAVLASLDVTGLDHIDVVAVGGEALPPALADMWSAGRLMLNAYGPTESTVAATLAEVDGHVTIGRPITGTTARVLDDRVRPVPVCGVGELYLSGPGLARGYVGSPGRTAVRFVATDDGERMYRTGDLVHRRVDRNLHYISRVDRQVKVRGVRIEPGEVDAAIRREHDVEGAVTVTRPNAVGADVLVSYVVPRGTLDTHLLESRLRVVLPSYLVPAAIVVLGSFPLNPSGKVDEKALPAPMFETKPFREPDTATARIVARIFTDMLSVDRIGLDDDFFALGGNSLIATQVAARLGDSLDADVPVRLLFEAPTVESLAVRLETEVDSRSRPPLVPQARPERIPLSLAQQRMWFLSRFDPDSPAYNIPLAVRLTGDLDVAALQPAVRDVLERHESLRTVFPEVDGEPTQVVLPVDRMDLDLVPVPVAADAVDGQVLAVAARGFDVTTAVPVRGRLLRIDDHEFVLVIVVHHISADGFSTVPLARDVMAAYLARAQGGSPSWTPLPVQYVDFALWQREVLGTERDPESLARKQFDYWARTLDGIPEVLELPTDRPRPAVPTQRGASVPLEIDEQTHAQLLALAEDRNSTLFMVMHAAVAVLLARVTGTSDIVIGTPVAGRGEKELDDLVGMFVNTLVLRTEVRPAASILDVLTRAREADLGAFAHADVPFERLVEILNPARNQSHSPLFQVMLAFQNLPKIALELPGLTAAPLGLDMGTSKFDLDFTFSDNYSSDGAADGMIGSLTYSTDVFDAESAQRFVEMFGRVLLGFIADPRTSVGEIPLLSDAERTRIVRGWNDTATSTPAQTLVDLLDAQAARTPDAIAVVFSDVALRYRELDERANQLARLLIAQGIGPDDFVALAFERSSEMVLAMCAVVKSGAAYVPLDPGHPPERIAYVLSTAKPECVLTTSFSPIPVSAGTARVDVDTVDLSEFPSEPVRDEERTRPLRPQNTAYVLFTSGSTGRPKGVMVPHSALVNQLCWIAAEFGMTADDRGMLRAPYTFDVSVWETFLPLITGARLVVTRPGGHREFEYLASIIREQGITTAHFVPSVLRAFIEDGNGAALSTLRHLQVGGEELTGELAEDALDWVTGAFHNTYGPTEAAITTTAYRLDRVPDGHAPIGSPVWNTRALVLDSRLQVVPVGVLGELYLGGDQLARGYAGRTDLTADRFVADPYGQPGRRIYRTGDLVKWTTGGQLVYLGRTDFQVKLRGLRIELGEIEAVLTHTPGVSRAAVTVWADSHAGDRLVAYVVAEPGWGLDPADLRTRARAELPSYMVPSQIIILDELPLASTGKLDRRALPEPLRDLREFQEPSTPSEIAVAQVFQDLLGVDRVGADDNFFELGGNSLMAVRVMSRVERSTGVALPLHVLMTDPTPRSIAVQLDTPVADDDGALRVLYPIRSTGAGRPLWCIHPIVGLAWCYTGLVSRVNPDRPIYGIQSPAVLEAGYMPTSIAELAERYVDEMRRVQPDGPYHVLGWSLGGVLGHEMAVQLQAAGEDVASLMMLDAYAHPPDEENQPEVSAADLLGGLGYEGDMPSVLADLTPESAVELLGAAGGPLAALTPAHVESMVAAAVHNGELLRKHTPRVFDGDVDFFTAGQDDPTGTRGASSWERYSTGTVHNRVVDSTHWQMTSPQVLRVVGNALRNMD